MERWPQGELQEAGWEGRDTGHYCWCSHFHTALLGPLLSCSQSPPRAQQSSVPTIQQYSTSIHRLLGGLRVIIIDEGLPRLPKGPIPGQAAAVSCGPLSPSELLGTCTPWLLPGPSHPVRHAGASLPFRRETPPTCTQPTAAQPCPPLRSWSFHEARPMDELRNIYCTPTVYWI